MQWSGASLSYLLYHREPSGGRRVVFVGLTLLLTEVDDMLLLQGTWICLW